MDPGFVGADWIREHRILAGNVYTVENGGIDVDGVRYVFTDPNDCYPDGTDVAVHIFFRRLRNTCQTVEQYQEDKRRYEERLRKEEAHQRKLEQQEPWVETEWPEELE